jgi:hypothetical protein
MRKAIRFVALALIPTLAVAASPTEAAEQPACSAIPDAAKRLACFDAAAKAAAATLQPAAGARAPAPSGWMIAESRSPTDGSLQIIATKSDGGDSFSGNDMILSCKAKRTQWQIVSRLIRGQTAGRNQLPVSLSVDGQPRVTQPWKVVADGSAFRTTVGYPDDQSLPAYLSSLPPSGLLGVEIADFQGVPRHMAFVLDGIDEARVRLAVACNWAGASPQPSPAQAAAPLK